MVKGEWVRGEWRYEGVSVSGAVNAVAVVSSSLGDRCTALAATVATVTLRLL